MKRQLPVPAKASMWFVICSFLQKGINVITIPIFTRILSPSEFGEYSLYQSWYSIIIIFATLNLFNYAFNNAMLKYKDDREGYTSSVQSLTTLLTFLCFCIYIILYSLEINITGIPLEVMSVMFVDIIFISGFNLWSSKQRFEFKYKKLVALTIIMSITNPIVAIIAIKLSGYGGYARVVAGAAVEIFFCSFIYGYNLWKGKKIYVKKYWGFSLKFCIPLIPHFLSSQILGHSDRIMINEMCGTEQAGLYNLANNAANIMWIINDSVHRSLTPWTYQKLENNQENDIKSICNVLLVLIATVDLLFILVAPEAMRFLASAEYQEAVYVIPPITCSVYFMFLFNLFVNIEYYFEKTKFITVASIGAAILNLILNTIFINKWGYLAAGYTTLLSYILYSTGHFVVLKHICKSYFGGKSVYDNRFIIKISFTFLLLSLCISFFYDAIVIRYSLLLLVLVCIVLKRGFFISCLKVIKNRT